MCHGTSKLLVNTALTLISYSLFNNPLNRVIYKPWVAVKWGALRLSVTWQNDVSVAARTFFFKKIVKQLLVENHRNYHVLTSICNSISYIIFLRTLVEFIFFFLNEEHHSDHSGVTDWPANARFLCESRFLLRPPPSHLCLTPLRSLSPSQVTSTNLHSRWPQEL